MLESLLLVVLDVGRHAALLVRYAESVDVQREMDILYMIPIDRAFLVGANNVCSATISVTTCSVSVRSDPRQLNYIDGLQRAAKSLSSHIMLLGRCFCSSSSRTNYKLYWLAVLHARTHTHTHTSTHIAAHT